MRVDLAGKRAIITGASQGIGRGVFEVFAQLGVRCVTAARRKNILEEHAKYVISTGGSLLSQLKWIFSTPVPQPIFLNKQRMLSEGWIFGECGWA